MDEQAIPPQPQQPAPDYIVGRVYETAGGVVPMADYADLQRRYDTALARIAELESSPQPPKE